MSAMRVVVAEDEAPARRKLRRLLEAERDVEVVGEAGDGATAWATIETVRPEVALLDIHMPAPDGLEIAARIATMDAPRPLVIFLTASEDHALRAFELRAADYLLKPYTAARLAEALGRVRERMPGMAWPARMAVDIGGRQVMVQCADIVRIVAAGNYVEVHAGERALLTRTTLENVAAQLDPEAFARINRSTVVAVGAICELRRRPHGELQVCLRDGSEATWTRRYRHAGQLIPALGQLIPKP